LNDGFPFLLKTIAQKKIKRVLKRGAALTVFITLTLAITGCETEDKFTFDATKMHGPLAIKVIPGQSLALVVSTNFDFANSINSPQQAGGILHVIDLTTNLLLPAVSQQINNFAGEISVDATNQRIFLADRSENLVRVYHYNIPNGGQPIDIVLESSFKTGKDPFALFSTAPTGAAFKKLYVADLKESELSLINTDNLALIDLDPKDVDSETLKLNEVGIGSLSFNGQLIRPNRFTSFGADDLVLLSTSTAGLLFVLDTKNDRFEAFINLQSLVASPQIHGMAITAGKLAYLASHSIEGILVLDLSGLSDNGVDNEVIIPPLVQTILTGSKIEAMLVSADGTRIYAANYSRNSVLVLDAVTGFINKEIPVGIGPAEMTLNDSGTQLLVTNYLGDSVSIIDTATDALVTTIQ
jgi:YVTN family beta-propeller protein